MKVRDYFMVMSPNPWKEHDFLCSCGQRHVLSIKEIDISEGALENLSNIREKFSLGKNALVVMDQTIYSIIGTRVSQLLTQDNCSVRFSLFNSSSVVPDEQALTKLLI